MSGPSAHAVARRLAVATVALIAAWSVVPATSVEASAARGGGRCADCHLGIEDAHPRKPLACVTCHRGDPTATSPAAAHRDMWPNPSDLRVVGLTCGAGGCHASIAARVTSSIMAHRAGTPSGSLFPNGLQRTREDPTFTMAPGPTRPGLPLPRGRRLPPGAVARLDPLPTFERSREPLIDLLRKECGSCHLWTPPRHVRGNFRATGCAACHMPYADDGRSESGDVAVPKTRTPRPLRHRLTTAIPVSQCATCHNGGSRAAMSFRGLMEAPPTGRQTFAYEQDLPHGHAYTREPADVHFERGLACVDCHTEREMHGDGQIYRKRHYEVEIRCETCHGTPGALATGLTAQGRRLRNLFVAATPNPLGLVTLVGKLTGRTHVVPQLATLRSQPPGHDAAHLARTECFTCHTAWAPTCYGCHIKMDYTAYRAPVDVAFDSLSAAYSRQGWFRLTPGVRFADPEPVLGLGWRGKVVPFVPRAQPLFTYVNAAGRTEYAFRKLGFAHNPIVPHTVTRGSRTCESCHDNPRALGLGGYPSREHPKLEAFGQPPDFRWDRIVDEDGVPVQVTTVDGARPLNRAEMDRLRGAAYKLVPRAPGR
jgi:hypothetical protein